MRFLFSHWCCLSALIGLGGHAVAQDLQLTDSAYNFYDYVGQARYEVVRIKRDSTVRNGTFSFVQKATEPSDVQQFNKLSVKGQYVQDKKSGAWIYTYAENTVRVKDVVAFDVKADLYSLSKELKASYSADAVPNGTWELVVSEYKSPGKTKLLSSNVLEFKAGYINGAVRITGDKTNGYNGLYLIQGKSTEDGLFDGLWELEYVRDTLALLEHRYYDKGFLTEVVKMSLGNPQDTLFYIEFKDTKSKLSILKVGSTELFKVSTSNFGIDYMAGFDQEDKRHLTQIHGNNYLKNVLEELIKYDLEFYLDSTRSPASWPLATKRFEFYISPEEQSLRDSISQTYAALRKTLNALNESNTLVLNNRRSDSLYYAIAYVHVLDTLLGRLQFPVEQIISDDCLYFDAMAYERNQDFTFMRVEAYPVVLDSLNILYIDKNFNAGLAKNQSLYKRLHHYLQMLNREMEATQNLIESELKSLKTSAELENLQATVLEKREILLKKAKKKKQNGSEEGQLITQIAQNLLVLGYDNFTSRYSKEKFEFNKIRLVTQYLEALERYENLLEELAVVYENRDVLDSLYTESVFNPYTYSTYNRRVKEKLYTEAEQLFAHYTNKLQQADGEKTIDDLMDKIKVLQRNLEKFRFADTRSLERMLRSKNTVEKLEQYLVTN